MRFRFWLCAFLLACSTALVAAQTAPTLQITEYALENGLEVILVEDHSAPTVAVNVWYHVGGANDPIERGGFAHLFEHMMFQGSAHAPKGEFDTLIQGAGGDNNAYTATEITGYYISMPAHQLPLALWLEADRMAALDVNQVNLDNQRAVVIEEYKQRVSNSPYGNAIQDLFTLPYTYAPYQRRVIGSIEELNKATVEDVRNFHNTYYRPNNATLVVAGDIDVAETKTLIESLFAPIPAGEEPPALPAYEPQQRTEAQVFEQVDGLIGSPAWLIGYEVPSRSHPDYPAIELLARILGGGTSSRLAVALLDSGQALDVGMFTDGNRGPSVLAGYIFPNSGVELSEVQAVYEAELQKIVDEGIDPAELEKVINGIRSERVAGLETALDLAESVQAANFYFDDPQMVFGEIARFEAVTVEDIQRVIVEYLAPEDGTIITVVPGEATTAEPPEPVVGATGSDADSAVEYNYVIEQDTPPAPLPISEFTMPTITEATLENGLQVVVIERPEVPIISLDVYFVGGDAAVSADKAGLADATATLLTRGTTTRSAQDIASTVEQVGGSIGASAARDSLNVGVFMLADQTDLAFDMLGDVTLNSTFPQEEFDIALSQMQTELEVNLADSSYVALDTFLNTLYGAHPYGTILTSDSLSAITRDDVVNFYAAQGRPENAILIVAGSITYEDAMAQAERIFGAWQGSGEAPAALEFPGVIEAETTKIYLVDRPGSSQAEIVMGNMGIMGASAERYPIQVMNNVFGGTFSSRLSMNIREEKGYTYGIYSGFTFPRDLGSFRITAAVRNEVVKEALDEVFSEITRIQTEEVPADELTRVKDNMTGSFALDLETYQAFVEQIAALKLRGLPIDTLAAYPAQIAAIDGATVTATAQQYLTQDAMVIVVVGDASVIQEALESIAPVVVIGE